MFLSFLVLTNFYAYAYNLFQGQKLSSDGNLKLRFDFIEHNDSEKKWNCLFVC